MSQMDTVLVPKISQSGIDFLLNEKNSHLINLFRCHVNTVVTLRLNITLHMYLNNSTPQYSRSILIVEIAAFKFPQMAVNAQVRVYLYWIFYYDIIWFSMWISCSWKMRNEYSTDVWNIIQGTSQSTRKRPYWNSEAWWKCTYP